MAWLMSACGAKPAMQGAQSDASSEEGSISRNGSDSPGGVGDTTSFDASPGEKVDEYVVHPGDNLWNIAAKGSVYHSGWLYPLIVKANQKKIKDPRNLPIGLMLKIPRDLPAPDYDVAREEAMAGVYEESGAALKDMKTDLPLAPPTPNSSAKPYTPYRRGANRWLIWLAVLALAGVGLWQFKRTRNRTE